VARVLTAAASALVLVGCQSAPPPSTPRAEPSRATGSPATTPDAPSSEAASTSSGRGRSSPNAGRARDLTTVELDTRLIDAAWKNQVDRARRLIAAGADVDAKDDTGQSAYLIATSEGYLRLLELTLRHGADVHSKDSYDGTGLIRAAERGHADVVGRLLRTDVEVDHVNELGWTALHEAVILGRDTPTYHDTVRLLVASGADVTLPSQREGKTALQQATDRRLDAAATTLRRAARSSEADPVAARANLLRAARRGDPDAVANALRAGARLESRDQNSRTPLLLAAMHDHVGVARLLVALGADADAQDYREDSAWLVTGVTGSVRMLETLLPAHPDLTLENRYGGTSLIPASERGHVRYVRRVLRTDIDVDHVNDLGWTALLEAVLLGDGSRPYQQIVRALLRAGADPSVADADGVTPLEHARARGQEAVSRLLRRPHTSAS
jgi:ankyrin repeat protein